MLISGIVVFLRYAALLQRRYYTPNLMCSVPLMTVDKMLYSFALLIVLCFVIWHYAEEKFSVVLCRKWSTVRSIYQFMMMLPLLWGSTVLQTIVIPCYVTNLALPHPSLGVQVSYDGSGCQVYSLALRSVRATGHCALCTSYTGLQLLFIATVIPYGHCSDFWQWYYYAVDYCTVMLQFYDVIDGVSWWCVSCVYIGRLACASLCAVVFLAMLFLVYESVDWILSTMCLLVFVNFSVVYSPPTNTWCSVEAACPT